MTLDGPGATGEEGKMHNAQFKEPQEYGISPWGGGGRHTLQLQGSYAE